MTWKNVLSPRNSRTVKLSPCPPVIPQQPTRRADMAPEPCHLKRMCEARGHHTSLQAGGIRLSPPPCLSACESTLCEHVEPRGRPRTLPPDVVQAQMGPRRDPQHSHLTDCRSVLRPAACASAGGAAARGREGKGREGTQERTAAIIHGAS